MIPYICDVAGWGYIKNLGAHRLSILSFDSRKLKATCCRRRLLSAVLIAQLNGEQGYIYWLFMVHYLTPEILS